jgi:hypothetical protein
MNTKKLKINLSNLILNHKVMLNFILNKLKTKNKLSSKSNLKLTFIRKNIKFFWKNVFNKMLTYNLYQNKQNQKIY